MRHHHRVLSIALVVFAGALADPATASAERMRAFTQTDYAGRETVFRDPIPNLSVTEVPPNIASVRVVTGRWLLCADVNFSGDCAWLAHDIPSLSDLGFTSSPGSLRPERIPVLMRHWGNRRPPPRESLVLFERPNYDGDWTAVSDSVPEFGAAHLNSPGSVVLGDGAWRLCTGPNYSGRCLIVTGSAWDITKIFLGQIHSVKRLK